MTFSEVSLNEALETLGELLAERKLSAEVVVTGADLRLLKPSPEELAEAGAWCQTHDPSEGFERMLMQALHFLGGKGD